MVHTLVYLLRGDGSSGTVSVTISSNVSAVTVTNVGSGYTIAYVTLADINSAGGGSLSGAELDCIIELKGSHGFDAKKELGGFFIMLNTTFTGAEAANSGDFTVSNDFRKVFLLRAQNQVVHASANTLRATKAIRFASSPFCSSFDVDEEINQASTGAVGKVVEYDSTNRILYYIQTRFNDEGADSNGNITAFSGTNVVTGQSTSATGTQDADSIVQLITYHLQMVMQLLN